MNQIHKDLTMKFREDIRHAMLHYINMCDAVGIRPTKQLASIMSSLVYWMARVAIYAGMTKEECRRAMELTWQIHEKEEEVDEQADRGIRAGS